MTVSAVVVIPVHNGEDDIERCLATILPEAAAIGGSVLVVDDASSDTSAGAAPSGLAAPARRASTPTAALTARGTRAGTRATRRCSMKGSDHGEHSPSLPVSQV